MRENPETFETFRGFKCPPALKESKTYHEIKLKVLTLCLEKFNQKIFRSDIIGQMKLSQLYERYRTGSFI